MHGPETGQFFSLPGWVGKLPNISPYPHPKSLNADTLPYQDSWLGLHLWIIDFKETFALNFKCQFYIVLFYFECFCCQKSTYNWATSFSGYYQTAAGEPGELKTGKPKDSLCPQAVYSLRWRNTTKREEPCESLLLMFLWPQVILSPVVMSRLDASVRLWSEILWLLFPVSASMYSECHTFESWAWYFQITILPFIEKVAVVRV